MNAELAGRFEFSHKDRPKLGLVQAVDRLGQRVVVALAYAANKPGAEVMHFSVANGDLADMAQAHVGQMDDDAAQAFVDQYSSLYGEGQDHGLDYISRPTARGTEHCFSSSVFGLLMWQ